MLPKLLKRKLMQRSEPLPKLRLLCDENVPHRLASLLESEGFNVARPVSGSDDSEVARKATSAGRVLVTFDKDFSNILLFPPERHAGIVFVRIRPPLIETVFSALVSLFKAVKHEDFKGKLFVLSVGRFRVYPKKALSEEQSKE
jgi:predicted nuclease of predicted toxin-antitoxin system